jgi:hypothetical protein
MPFSRFETHVFVTFFNSEHNPSDALISLPFCFTARFLSPYMRFLCFVKDSLCHFNVLADSGVKESGAKKQGFQGSTISICTGYKMWLHNLIRIYYM